MLIRSIWSSFSHELETRDSCFFITSLWAFCARNWNKWNIRWQRRLLKVLLYESLVKYHCDEIRNILAISRTRSSGQFIIKHLGISSINWENCRLPHVHLNTTVGSKIARNIKHENWRFNGRAKVFLWDNQLDLLQLLIAISEPNLPQSR